MLMVFVLCVSGRSMNRLVMDYLVGKGYRDVAEAFWRDSNTKREYLGHPGVYLLTYLRY